MHEQVKILPDPFLDAVAIYGEALERANDVNSQNLIGRQLPNVARIGGVVGTR